MTPKKSIALFLIVLSYALAVHAAPTMKPTSLHKRPRLVVVISIDQFRSDYLTRFANRFLPAVNKTGDVGGFRYLMEKGAHFANAQYDVLQCMTGPGHAMILSGSYPHAMGIALNEWFDVKTGKEIYCVGDDASALVGPVGSNERGMSPKNFEGTTVGDELKNAGHSSKVVAVALKDRAAILMGGHRADLAFWLSNQMQWVTSRYYLKSGELPSWIEKLNAELLRRKGETYVWETKEKETGLSIPFGNGEFRRSVMAGSKVSLATPFGVEITTTAAQAAIDAYRLGQGSATDILAVSYSTHDYAGHVHGPNARELEEMTVFEDRSLALLFNHVRKTVPGGLKDVVIVLTADHGVAPHPYFLKQTGIQSGYIESEPLLDKVESALSAKFGKPSQKWIADLQSFNFYLNPKAFEERKAAKADVENEAKKALATVPGVAHVLTQTEYLENRLPPGFHARQIRNSYIPAKSGDLLLIPKPFFMEAGNSTTHMTGYSYDRSVPIIMAGARLRAGVYANPADVIDIAPTLSFLLGVLPPATSEGRVLSEALGD